MKFWGRRWVIWDRKTTQKEENVIKLGSRAQDSITGFKGIVIARTEWLHGCARITIQPEELRDGKPIETCTFDEQQVVLLEARPRFVSPDSDAASGGPHDEPVRCSDPVR